MYLVVNLSFGSEKQETGLLINCNQAEQNAHVCILRQSIYVPVTAFCNLQSILVVLILEV